jgi:hypothetical protein
VYDDLAGAGGVAQSGGIEPHLGHDQGTFLRRQSAGLTLPNAP